MESTTIIQPLKKGSGLHTQTCFLLEKYHLEIYQNLADLPDDWDEFALKNNKYYQRHLIGVAEKARLTDIDFYYIVVRVKGNIVALFYFQSLIVRKEYYPDFSDLSFAAKNLYCIISSHNYRLLVNGHIFSTDINGGVLSTTMKNNQDLFYVYEKVLTKVKRASCSSIFIAKDIPMPFQGKMLELKRKYKSMPEDVLMEMRIPAHWLEIDDYIDSLSKKYAVRAKKIEQSIKHFQIEDFSQSEILGNEVILQQLYLNVISKSSFKLGMLNIRYFAEMKLAYKNDFKFKVWKLQGEIVGFTTYIISESHIELYYIGIDYKINKSHHLYQCMLQHGISVAIQRKSSVLKLGRTAYEAKAIVGAKPVVKHNFFQINNPLLKIGYRYSADYFISENNTNWQKRNPFKESVETN